MTQFALFVAVGSLVAVAAVLSNRLTILFHVPAPAFFLLAAVVSALFPWVNQLSLHAVPNLVTVALVFVLFNGGLSIGWRALRPRWGRSRYWA